MKTQELLAPLRDLYNVCNQFTMRAEAGADIRQHGLTPELLEQCRVSLEQFMAAEASGPGQPRERSDLLPSDLAQDGWQLFMTSDNRWYAHHPNFNRRTGAYPTLDEALMEARVAARPY